MTSPAPVSLHPALAEEDRARAEFYALLGRLFGSPPDRALLDAIGGAQPWPADGDDALANAWNRVILASQAMDVDAAEQEYTELFVGVGKSECNLHAAYWMGDSGTQPRVAVRAELAALGLGRQGGSAVYEDHLAALCETMRVLVAGLPGRPPATISAQHAFFAHYLEPWVFDCCNAICNSSIANYYVRVGQFTNAFLALERDSFAIE